MRTAKPRSKIKTQASIPAPLRNFLGDVLVQIDAGDAAATLESADLLQSEFCYGGLIDAETVLFAFTFFPGPARSQKWHWPDEISSLLIATGDPTDIGRLAARHRSLGVFAI